MSHLTFTIGEVQSPYGPLDPHWIPSSAAGGALGYKNLECGGLGSSKHVDVVGIQSFNNLS